MACTGRPVLLHLLHKVSRSMNCRVWEEAQRTASTPGQRELQRRRQRCLRLACGCAVAALRLQSACRQRAQSAPAGAARPLLAAGSDPAGAHLHTENDSGGVQPLTWQSVLELKRHLSSQGRQSTVGAGMWDCERTLRWQQDGALGCVAAVLRQARRLVLRGGCSRQLCRLLGRSLRAWRARLPTLPLGLRTSAGRLGD